MGWVTCVGSNFSLMVHTSVLAVGWLLVTCKEAHSVCLGINFTLFFSIVLSCWNITYAQKNAQIISIQFYSFSQAEYTHVTTIKSQEKISRIPETIIPEWTHFVWFILYIKWNQTVPCLASFAQQYFCEQNTLLTTYFLLVIAMCSFSLCKLFHYVTMPHYPFYRQWYQWWKIFPIPFKVLQADLTIKLTWDWLAGGKQIKD